MARNTTTETAGRGEPLVNCLKLPIDHEVGASNRCENLCIHENFEAQALRSPEAIALTFHDCQVSYAELNSHANHLARALLDLGVGPESPVALYFERSIEMVVAILAVLKAGGAYVPIDLAYPRERIAFMLQDTAAPVVLTQTRLKERLPLTKATILCVDSLAVPAAPTPNPSTRVSAHNAAYIIYTSGSTGQPKGVIVTHRNVVRLLRSTQHWFKFNASDVWPLFHSYSFDMSVWELWGALFYGGRLVIVPHEIARSPQDFYALLSRERVTFLNQTPSAFRQLIWADAAKAEPLKLHLRYVTCGGEALELQSLRPWFDLHGDRSPVVVNMYGITETTVHTTYRPISRADLDKSVGSVFGVPIPDLQVYLLDENLKPVPDGEPGEICVGGAGVARGYLHRPDLNAQRFVLDPFARDGSSMYRSGDLARVNAQGEMEYLGRMDHQVKIRGFRVELGEIESALNRHPAVRESVVLARGQEPGKRLVAYFVPQEASPGTGELRSYLAPLLPDYMVPALFVSMRSFPLTNNGKIDRRALPEPGNERPDLCTAYTPPRSDAERELAAIWEEALRVGPIGMHDNYFELGGDSIRAIMLLAAAAKRGYSFSIQDLFQSPTVAALAPRNRGNPSLAPVRTAAPFSMIHAEDRARLPETVEDAYPVAALQLGMFFHNELDPLSAMYHDVFSFEIGAVFDADKLVASAQALLDRHPMLRTSFHLSGFSEPLQAVHRRVRPPFSFEDNRAVPQAKRDAAVLEWIEKEKRSPFDRTVPPLVRFHVQRLTDDRFQLFVSFHHSCTDGWSLAVLVTELLRDYAHLLAGRQTMTERSPVGYRDFIALERASAASPDTRRFWKEFLSGMAPQKLPRWPKHLRSGGREQQRGPEIQISPSTLEGLRQLAQRAGVPLKTVLLTAHLRVMSLLGGTRDVVTGLISNGRPEEDGAEKLVGLFLNTVPLRQQISPGSWIDLVRQTFATEQAILPHRRFPLVEIQKLHGEAMLESAFDFVNFHVLEDLRACGDLTFSEGPYFEANNLATYTTFMLDPGSTRLELHIDFDPNEITREQVVQMDDYYVRTLEAMASAPEAEWTLASPFPPAELRRMLVDWNDTAKNYPEDSGIHALFESVAKRQPDAPAVECNGTVLSYGELDARANAVAAALLNHGVEDEMPIGLCLERSADMVAGLLGILKAGAAYVPLDPGFPKERLESIAQDAGLKLCVTERKTLASLPQTGAETVLMDDLRPGTPRDCEKRGRGRNLAYIIYTSGSTGKPKGVQIEHRSVVNLLFSAADKLGASHEDRLLAVTTLSFDIAGLELFMPLLTGGTIVIASRETTADGPALARLLDTSRATLMQATPSTWRMLIEAGWTGSPQLKIICGGEALPHSLAGDLRGRCRELWNFYGPTETTIWSTTEQIEKGEGVTIGRPLANTQAYILDANGNPLPVGGIGELLLGGHGLARGYMNRPELTAEKFIDHPFEPGERLYRTGDLARFLPDGRIDCLGRIDHQVKIRGHRIEPGEIENALATHHKVRMALVTAIEDRFGEKRLTAYVVPANGSVPVKELRGHLAGKLPAYMVPSHFVQLRELPRLPNGKVDHRQLPNPEEASTAPVTYVPPAGDLEVRLSSIWQEVLGLSRIGAEDNFFDLGADSLSATRAFARINSALSSQITLQDIFEHPTIRALGKVAAGKNSAPADSPIKRQPRFQTHGG